MVGISQEAATDSILYNIDQYDAIGVSTRSSYRPGLTGLLTHCRLTILLLRNPNNVQPLRPAPYTLAQVTAIYRYLTGETARGAYAHDESRRVGAFLRNHMNSRDRWHPTATNPTTGAPCTLADNEVWYFPETRYRVAGPGGLQVDPANPPTPSTPSTGRRSTGDARTPTSIRRFDASGNAILSDGSIVAGDSFPDDPLADTSDELNVVPTVAATGTTGNASNTGETGDNTDVEETDVTAFLEVRKRLDAAKDPAKGKAVDRGNNNDRGGGAGASAIA